MNHGNEFGSNGQQSIVVYNSESERMADQFWVNNPDYLIAAQIVNLAIVVSVFGFILYKIFKKSPSKF